MDWRKFRRFLANEYDVTKAYMFIGYVPEFEPLYDQMHDAGYMVVLKPTFDVTRPQEEAPHETKTEQAEEKKPVKGNIDADLVLWAMKEINNYDQALLVSDDGDFFGLVEYLAEQGKLKKLLTPTQHYSSLYRPYEKYIDQVWRFRRKLSYYDRKKK